MTALCQLVAHVGVQADHVDLIEVMTEEAIGSLYQSLVAAGTNNGTIINRIGRLNQHDMREART